MLNRVGRYLVVTVALTLLVSLSLVDVGAQKRKKKRSRRARRPVATRPVITNPPIAPPTTAENATGNDVKIISTADESAAEPEQGAETLQPKKPKTTMPSSDQDEMQRTITSLSNQVNRLNDRLSKMQEDDRYLMDMERLTRAEQRAEQLRTQLIDVQSKMADLQSRLDQVEYFLKPENIEKATQGYGTVHPEEARDARRAQLENERSRLQAQLDILEKSRVRLESAITTADSEVDLLKARLDQQRDQQNPVTPSDARPTIPRKP
jgi:chromosome segregation ATPase